MDRRTFLEASTLISVSLPRLSKADPAISVEASRNVRRSICTSNQNF